MSKTKLAFNQHHRKCRSNGGTDDESNVVLVPTHLHQAWHVLFKNWKAELIAKFINEVWCDPDVEFVVRYKVTTIEEPVEVNDGAFVALTF